MVRSSSSFLHFHTSLRAHPFKASTSQTPFTPTDPPLTLQRAFCGEFDKHFPFSRAAPDNQRPYQLPMSISPVEQSTAQAPNHLPSLDSASVMHQRYDASRCVSSISGSVNVPCVSIATTSRLTIPTCTLIIVMRHHQIRAAGHE